MTSDCLHAPLRAGLRLRLLQALLLHQVRLLPLLRQCDLLHLLLLLLVKVLNLLLVQQATVGVLGTLVCERPAWAEAGAQGRVEHHTARYLQCCL